MSRPVLDISDLEVTYQIAGQPYAAVRDVSLQVGPGEVHGLVGESGCGKSTLAGAVLRLLPPGGAITRGRVDVDGRDVRALDGDALRQFRGRDVAMIFQDPYTSLNPAFSVGYQLELVQRAHARDARKRQARTDAAAMLGRVGLPDPDAAMRAHPHQLSGGQRQRVMIAMALLLQPRLIIADEPTSALDVTLEAQILRLLRELRDEHGTAVLFVSHDLGSVAQLADRVTVMYAGQAVETADVRALFGAPRHPYTRALAEAVPSWRRRTDRLATIPGRPPSLTETPPGCRFAPRCPAAREVCLEVDPAPVHLDTHEVRCLAHDPSSAYADSSPLDRQPVPEGAR